MPLYEMVMIAKVGESHALGACLKMMASTVLSSGGIVRNFDNLGDRILIKNLRAKDGQRFSVGRFIKIEFDATPNLMKIVDASVRGHEEVLRCNTNKMKEKDYIDRVMKRLNSELSPFRDKETYDEDYIRAMWTKYT